MNSVWDTQHTLLVRIKDRDDGRAWEDFVSRYGGFIHMILRRMNFYSADCDDIVQEILVKLWHVLPQNAYDPERAHFRTWLGRLIKNHIIDEIRKKQRFGEFIGGDKLLENVRTTDVQKIEQIAEIEWRVHIVSLALKNVSSFFSDRAMKAFSMSMEGVETRQIATQLRIKPNSVIKLRNRVKYRVIKEIQYLRNKLK